MIGQVYTHKKTGDRLRVLKVGEYVTVCEFIDKPMEWVDMLVKAWRLKRCVCAIENLIKIEGQLTFV